MLKHKKGKSLFKVLICFVVVAFGSSGFAAGLQSSRVLPTEKVILYRGDQKVGQFTSEAPFPEGYLLETKGRCAVKMNELYLVAEDGSFFSIHGPQDGREIQLIKGTVFFALSASSQSLIFDTPSQVFTAEQIIVNASTDNVLKGYLSVKPEGTELGVIEGGSMMVSTGKGTRMLKSGERILVAESGKGASGAVSSKDVPRKDEEPKDDRSGPSALLIGGIGAGLAGIAALALSGSGGSSGGKGDVSPFTP
jgi:hypothetical protein